MNFDVIIVGGSFAGQAAALQLGRARRQVLLLDAGHPRNRFAQSSHGFPGQDGVPPAEIISTFSHQLKTYGTVTQHSGEATAASAHNGGFQVDIKDGEPCFGHRLILASGIRDNLPPIPGLQERWGASVLHCPYCHGYELDRQPVGVLGDNEMAFHQAMLVPDWGPTTLFTQGSLTLSRHQQGALANRGTLIEHTPIRELLGRNSRLEAVRLVDGRTVRLAGLFITPGTEPAGELATSLGCALHDGPTGPYISVDGHQQTSVPGVFAAGDVSAPLSNALLSAASGVRAASGAHHSLVFEDSEAA